MSKYSSLIELQLIVLCYVGQQQLKISALFFVHYSPQATWCTVLHMTTSSTIDGPLTPPVGHTWLWRTSNLTPGITHYHLLCVYINVYACIQHTHARFGVDFRFSDSQYHCTHGSHRKRESDLQTKICYVETWLTQNCM